MTEHTPEHRGYTIQRRVGLGPFRNCRSVRPTGNLASVRARFAELRAAFSGRVTSRLKKTVEYRIVKFEALEIDRFSVPE